MLGKFVRILFAITAIAPLSVSLAYIYAFHDRNLQFAAIAAFLCLLLGALSRWVIDQSRQRLERLPISIKKAKSADKEVIGFFVAYVFPLVFKGQAAAALDAWAVAAAMLLFVLWSTHSLQVNPVLGMLGFHFYEVETADGVTYLLITQRKISNVLSITEIVQLSEYGILEAPKKSRRGNA